MNDLVWTSNHRKRFRWLWLVYPVLWGPLWLLYTKANRAYGTEMPDVPLTPVWWLLVLLFFLADVTLVLGLKFLSRMPAFSDTPPEESFWYEASEIVPIWFLLHLTLLVLAYPISWRLESVGLAKLEVIVFIAFIVAGAAYLFRPLTRARHHRGPKADGTL